MYSEKGSIDLYNKIYNIDCLQGMVDIIPDESIDLIITDPPYNTSKSKSFINKDKSAGFNGWKPIREAWDSMSNDEFKVLISGVLDQCHRVLKRSGSIYICMGMGNLHIIGSELARLKFTTLNIISWYQPNKFPMNYGKTRYNPATELFYFSRKGKSHFFQYTEFLRDMWTINAVQSGKNRLHPAQKPVELFERFIEHSCPEKGIVLDPFIGSGTTAIAAINKNRHFLGFEKNTDVFNTCMKRVNDRIEVDV